MVIQLDDMRVGYEDKGEARGGGGETILLLHGWKKGFSKESYKELIEELAKDFRVVALDLPGFGESQEPDKPWGVGDYADMVGKFLDLMKINRCIIVAHSFGGRVALKMAAGPPAGQDKRIKKLILIAAAGIERKSGKVRMLAWLAERLPAGMKKIGAKILGSKDYEEARGVMRESMKLVVAENLEADLDRVTVPTILIWGDKDRTTPLWQGRLMEKKIRGAKMVIIKGGNHGLPYRRAGEAVKIIRQYLK